MISPKYYSVFHQDLWWVEERNDCGRVQLFFNVIAFMVNHLTKLSNGISSILLLPCRALFPDQMLRQLSAVFWWSLLQSPGKSIQNSTIHVITCCCYPFSYVSPNSLQGGVVIRFSEVGKGKLKFPCRYDAPASVVTITLSDLTNFYFVG